MISVCLKFVTQYPASRDSPSIILEDRKATLLAGIVTDAWWLNNKGGGMNYIALSWCFCSLYFLCGRKVSFWVMFWAVGLFGVFVLAQVNMGLWPHLHRPVTKITEYPPWAHKLRPSSVNLLCTTAYNSTPFSASFRCIWDCLFSKFSHYWCPSMVWHMLPRRREVF